MPNNTDCSIEDETYIAAVMAEPKMTMDEVGADIETHGHVPVTPETATQNPFTAKGSLANALDEAADSIPSVDSNGAPDQGEYILPEKKLDGNTQLIDPSNDFRDETKGDIEGVTDAPQSILKDEEGDTEPMVQQDSAAFVRDSLVSALDSVAMDAEPKEAKGNQNQIADYSEENASFIPHEAPDVPQSLGGTDKPDENGLVYVTATFTVDPDKYVSTNYRASSATNNKPLTAKDVAKKTLASGNGVGGSITAQGEEPTVVGNEPINGNLGKSAEDEAVDKIVLDYATFIDGSSFLCFDEISNIDYTKIAMDAGPKKKVTRENCETTFAQCRAKNPLFCRFHGPKLLEADIKTAIKATVGPGCMVQVTKDKNSKNKFTFRLTVGCPPSKKKMVEKMVHMYLTQNPGITSSTEDWNLVGKHKQTQEFEMDILQADNPPKKDTKADQALADTKKAIKAHKKQEVVGETAPALEKKAAKGEKWASVDDAVENEWADLVDNNVHKSKLGNNEEFLDNFDKIAEQFDAAHDAGDAEGLKEALNALKAEIGKYDEETGEKKPDAKENVATEASEVQQQTAETPDDDSWKDDMEMEWHQEVSNEAQKNFANTDKGEVGEEEIGEKEKLLAVDARADYEGYSEEEKEKLLQNLNKVLSGKGFPEDVDTVPEGYPYTRRESAKQWLEAVESIKGSVEPLVKALTAIKDISKKGEKVGGSNSGNEEVVLPAPSSVSKGNDPALENAKNQLAEALKGTNYENPKVEKNTAVSKSGFALIFGKGPSISLYADFDEDGNFVEYGLYDAVDGGYGETKNLQEVTDQFEKVIKDYKPANLGGYKENAAPNQKTNEASSPHGEKVKELANKIEDMQQQVKSMLENGGDIGTINTINKTLNGAILTLAKLMNQYDTIDELDAQMKAVGEDSDLFEVDKTFEQKLIEGSKKKAEEQASVLLNELESALSGIEKSFARAQETSVDKKKAEVADKVEASIKNLGAFVYGGKRPPQGVDSVTDYLDYLKDEMESDGETNLSPEEMSDIEDQYHLEDAYKATKAAAKAMDDAIAAFKDKMDEIPSQGEDNGTYQSDIEQLQKAVASQAAEVMSAFGAYKSALEKCKYEADAAKKLAESKKKLEGGGAQGSSSGGEVTKADIEDFFGQTFDENDSSEKGALDLWKEIATKGTMYGDAGKTKTYFDSMGGWLQGLMKNKGINHPMTKALVKAGLNLPKGMEQGNGGSAKQDLSAKVGKPFEGLQHDIKPLISNVLSHNGKFTNFDTFDDSSGDGTLHFIRMEKRQKEGYDEDHDEEEVPSAEELENLLKQMNDEFSQYGLKVKPSTKMKNYGKNVYFEVGKKDSVEPSKKQAEPSTPAKSQMSDEEKKAKIAAMSPKQKVEAAVKIFKKKLAANPNDADAKAKLAKYEAMLAKLGK